MLSQSVLSAPLSWIMYRATVGKRGVSLTLSLQRLTALPYQNATKHEQYK